MDIEEVKKLIFKGESKRIEYKKSIAELDKLGKAVSGFLNTEGGVGLIGITDSKKIIGIDVTDSTKMKLTTFCNHFDPWPNLMIDYVAIPDSDKHVVVICSEKNKKEGPFTYKGRPYIKTESGLQLMPSEKYKHLLLEHAGLSKAWESIHANGYTINDLDHEEIIRTFKVGLREKRIPDDEYTEDVYEILTHFDLVQGTILNNAAMVLFAKKTPADYSQCFIRMGRFVDETMDDVIDSKQIRGNAFQLLAEAQEFIRKNIPISSRYDPNQFERVDEAALPLLAVREAIINAIVHRDYSKRSGDIAILIFNNFLEIHNVGHLYGGLTVEQLSQRHPSRRRNERIAQVFFARKLIDRWGGGTRRILKLCADVGLPKPEFAEESDGFAIRFFFKEPIGPVAIKKEAFPAYNLNERQNEILQVLATTDSLPLRGILERLTDPPAARTVGDDLADLKLKGLVDSEGMGRGAKWYLAKKS